MSMVQVVNHDVPTDPVKLRKLRLIQADAAIKSAKVKIKTAKEDLVAAEKALAEAIAHKEGI